MSDPFLRRLERTAVGACLVMAATALVVADVWAALGVLGGGILAATSYLGIASGVTALTRAVERISARETPGSHEKTSGPRPTSAGRTLALVILRYALLILLAYVMIARLRLPPLGVVAGVSSVVAAAGIEAVRTLVKKS